MKRIGLIGFGKIGKYLYENMRSEAEFVFIYDITEPQDAQAKKLWTKDCGEMLTRAKNVDLAVEASVPDLLAQIAVPLLGATNLLPLSLTAFADDELLHAAKNICTQTGHNLYVPHGAILGLDGLLGTNRLLRSVSITTTKKPKNLGLAECARKIVYDGSTRGACAAFPRNVNVHAAVALTGLGFERTQSIIVADPDSEGNRHVIDICGDGYRFKIEVLSEAGSGVTGAYTPVSVLNSVRRILSAEEITIA